MAVRTPAAAVAVHIPAEVHSPVVAAEAAVRSQEAAVLRPEAVEAEVTAVADKKNKVAMWSPYLIYAYVRVCALVCRQHVLGVEKLVELLFAEQTMLEDEVIHTFSGLQRLFGNLR